VHMQKVLEKVLDSSTWGAREIVEGLSRFGEWQIVESVKGPCTDEVKMSYVPVFIDNLSVASANPPPSSSPSTF
jgi:hypothetical protein